MKKAVIFLKFAALALTSTSALAITLTSPIDHQEQIHSMWCWNASVRNFMYTESRGSVNVHQCEIGNFVAKISYACKYNNVFNWKNRANSANSMEKTGTNDVYTVLKRYGFKKINYSTKALSFSNIKATVDRNRGVLTFWKWKKSGGHFVVVNGYHILPNGSQWVKLSNPWPGEGQYWSTYNEYVGGSAATYSHTTEGSITIASAR